MNGAGDVPGVVFTAGAYINDGRCSALAASSSAWMTDIPGTLIASKANRIRLCFNDVSICINWFILQYQQSAGLERSLPADPAEKGSLIICGIGCKV